MHFWLCWVFVAARAFLRLWRAGVTLLWCAGFPRSGLSRCRAWAQQLWCVAFVAPQHVGSPQARDGTRVPRIGRWLLNRWTTREVHCYIFPFSALTSWSEGL